MEQKEDRIDVRACEWLSVEPWPPHAPKMQK